MKQSLKVLSAAIILANTYGTRAQAQDPELDTGSADELIEVLTTGKFIPDEKRATAAISNVIDAAAFEAAGDSSVADGLKRVSGLNLQGGKFIYIRGLGERYSSTVLNGSTLPSPEPVNRVVPLDLFPSSIIESVLVQKTFSAQYPAEFAGGTIQMRTKVVPDQSFFTISSSVGYSGGTTADDGYIYSGGDNDWLGTDDGSRDMPAPLKNAIAGGRELKLNNIFFQDGFEPEELESIGESLSNNYTTREESIQPDVNASATFGTGTYLDDFRVGILGNLSYANSWNTIEVSRNTYASNSLGELSQSDDMIFRSTEQSVDTSMFLTAGIEYADDHTLKATLLQIRKMDDLAGKQTGYQNTEGVYLDQTRLEWIERDLLSQQIQGEHYFSDLSELTLNWHYNQSRAKQDAPDMREYRYDSSEADRDFAFSLRGDANTRMWSSLEDKNTDMGFSANLYFATPFDTNTDLSFGLTRIDRDRDSDIRRFTFISKGGVSNDPVLRSDPSLDNVINATTIGPGGYQLRESTRPTDNYLATQELDSWFVEADIELSYRFRMLAGVRAEQSYQSVKTFDLFRPDAAVISELESDDLFPVITGTWIIDDYDMQVRLGYSETISRPDFRELSPAPYTHPVTGYIVVGNPDLDVAYIKNYDARWEWYYSADESISIGLFYKEFDSPIEAVVEASSSNQRTFINAQEATTYGIEFDTYRWLDFINPELESFYVSANLTLIDSEVTIREQDAGILTNQTRRLQGQAGLITNLQLGYDDGYKQKGSLVYHLTGDKIREVGVLGAPDIMDEAYGELDFTYTRFLTDNMELSFKAKNLLNQLQETTQGGLDVNSYKEGTSASLGLKYTF